MHGTSQCFEEVAEVAFQLGDDFFDANRPNFICYFIQVMGQRPYLKLLRHEQQEQQMQQQRKELAFMRKKLSLPTDPLRWKVEMIHF